MIVIEGPDGVGKTTAAKRLAEGYEMEYRHLSKPPDDFDHAVAYLREARETAPGRLAVVQDRFHVSAAVYGFMLGRGGHPTGAELAGVIAELRRLGSLVVVMYSSTDEWLSRRLTEHRKPEMYDRETILAANAGFAALARSSSGSSGNKYADVTYDVATHGFPSKQTLDFWRYLWVRAGAKSC